MSYFLPFRDNIFYPKVIKVGKYFTLRDFVRFSVKITVFFVELKQYLLYKEHSFFFPFYCFIIYILNILSHKNREVSLCGLYSSKFILKLF